jgi:purine-binding chemotaxis protein CheW
MIEKMAVELELDKVLIIPNKIPTHKRCDDLADNKHRVAMCKIAFNSPKFEVSTMEMDRETSSYTIFTVDELKKKYPDAKVRIYAQDTDLLSVSNASLISIPSELVSDWYGPYLTKKANGDYTFSQEIKDSIMFEYHDCKNTNALPMVDIVFARDILSLLDNKSQDNVIADFLDKMKGNAIAFVGDNEALSQSFGFCEKTVDALVVYNKD